MKLKDAVFCGFTKKELSRIREAKGSGEREVSLTDSQDIADIVEADVMTMFFSFGVWPTASFSLSSLNSS